MSSPEGPSQLGASSERFITFRIRRSTGWLVVAGLALLVGLGDLVVRERSLGKPQVSQLPVEEAPQPVVAPASVETSAVPPAREQPKPLPQPQPVAVALPASPAPVRESRSVADLRPGRAPAAEPAPPTGYFDFPSYVSTSPANLVGAGSGVALPVYSAWFAQFHQMHPEVNFKYNVTGRDQGIRKLLAGSADFSGTDVPLTDAQADAAEVKVLHVPTVLDAVVPIYNVTGAIGLQFTPEILAGIFLGKITKWNDPEIVNANPALRLPDQAIVVVHRSDPGGSTYMFTDYLSKVSTDWQSSVGKGALVSWPVGVGAKGDEGVVGSVHQIDGSIGYIDFIYATQSHVQFTSVANHAGNFEKASEMTIFAAASSVRDLPKDFRAAISAITDAPGTHAYPITGFVWLLIPRESLDPAKREDLRAFLLWALKDVGNVPRGSGYVHLPPDLARQVGRAVFEGR